MCMNEFFFRNFRMRPSTFEKLLSWIGAAICKSGLRRATASPAERLCVTLRYLCTGDAQISIATSYRISPTTIGRIIGETSQAIWNILIKIVCKVLHSFDTLWWKKNRNKVITTFSRMIGVEHCFCVEICWYIFFINPFPIESFIPLI